MMKYVSDANDYIMSNTLIFFWASFQRNQIDIDSINLCKNICYILYAKTSRVTRAIYLALENHDSTW